MSKKSAIITLIAVVVIVLAGWWIIASRNNSTTTTTTPTAGQMAAQTPTASSTTPVASTTVPSTGTGAPGSANNIAYNKALEIYGKGYRFQFSQCHGTPRYISVRQGVKLMLDNRDNKAHTIVVKSQTFHLPSYGFAIITAKDAGTYNITCDGGGAGQLNVEAK